MADAQAAADQASIEAEKANERARYAQALADALALDRLALVRHTWAPPSWTITYQHRVIGEVTNTRPDASAALGGWRAQPTDGEPTGPYRTARAAAAALIPGGARDSRST